MFNRLNAKLWVGVDENVKEEMEAMKQDAKRQAALKGGKVEKTSKRKKS